MTYYFSFLFFYHTLRVVQEISTLAYLINDTRLESYNDPRLSTNQSVNQNKTDGRTPSPEIMNHFSSLCFRLCLGVDQF